MLLRAVRQHVAKASDERVVVEDRRGLASSLPQLARPVMHTADLELSERLEVDPQTGDLAITWTIDDPAYFREPLTQRELFVRSTRMESRYDCKPGYQQ